MPSISELFANTAVRIALAVVALILVGSVTYYLIETQQPKITNTTVTTGNLTEDVTATGTVSPVQNPTLSFEVGGQVTSVTATVGEKVGAGTLLASLDTGVLSANLEAAQAKLDGMLAAPRSVDVAGEQTAVSSQQQNLDNTYSNYPETLASTFAQAQSAVTSVDPLFDFSYRTNPAIYATPDANDTALKITVDQERASLITLFPEWQAQLAAATSSPSAATLQSLTTTSLSNLETIRTFLTNLVSVLNDAEIGPSYTQAQQTAALTSANAALVQVNGLISSLTSANQAIASQQLAIQSAQDQLNETTAGATSQDIAAQQAQIAAIDAQIRQQEIVAPFTGTIASVAVKAGDSVGANDPVVTLIPDGTFEVDVYVAENDLAKIKVGDPTDITLDAYGAGRIFPATVASIETSPSSVPNTSGANAMSGYKVTLVFVNADPSIANGMSANATIHAGSVQNAVLVPKSAIITQGATTFVLKQTSNGFVKTSVTTGLSSDTQIQVTSGLAAGDVISAVGSQ